MQEMEIWTNDMENNDFNDVTELIVNYFSCSYGHYNSNDVLHYWIPGISPIIYLFLLSLSY